MEKEINILCPICKNRKVEAVARTFYVRGIIIVMQIAKKTFVGCVHCVRMELLKEAGISSLIGWFSFSSFFINPVAIFYNLIRGIFIRKNYAGVRRFLKSVGISEEQTEFDLMKAIYNVATSMIAADGKIENDEISVASDIGKKMFKEFNDSDFQDVLKNYKEALPFHELILLMKENLSLVGKISIYKYLEAIANADQNLAKEEEELLIKVREAFKLPGLEAQQSE